MEIYLVRHTTPDVSKEVCYGQSDISLADTFSEESKQVMQQLPESIEQVYSSPLQRCLALANLISSQRVEQIPELMEMNFGCWEMRRWSEIPEDELNPWMSDFVNHQVPNGESMQDLADRVYCWYVDLLSKDLKTVAIVTHAGPMRVILSRVNETPLSEAFRLYPVAYGEVKVISTF